MIKFIEFLAFGVSFAALCYGSYSLIQKEIPKYFQLYVFASGCYFLEELWVIVNSFLGNGARDGLITVRLFGFFGCLCFILSANLNEFDQIVDEGSHKKADQLAWIAPLLLLLIFGSYIILNDFTLSVLKILAGFLILSPALPGSYLSLKNLLLPEDEMGFLKITKNINKMALIFYLANYLYPNLDIYFSRLSMSIMDLILSFILLTLLILCRKGAKEWKALI